MTWRQFPSSRLRRLRAKEFSRRLISEVRLSVDHLIWPIFVCEDSSLAGPVASMPGVKRYTLAEALEKIQEAQALGIPAVAPFPVIPPKEKSPDGAGAYDDSNLIPRLIRKAKELVPNVGIISDVALDPYTNHGQDGLLSADGAVLNDETTEVLVKQALCCARAGADMVAPSDMMDGRIGAIRNALEEAGYHHTQILAYAAKYASHFYGPFREAVGSAHALGKSSKETYQMDPRNASEAIEEMILDIAEGADVVMVKPGLPYLDIIRRVCEEVRVPVFAYQVSGEYSMLKAAVERGWLDEKKCVLESLVCLQRAGAKGIFTYFAPQVAKWLKEDQFL